MLYRITSVKSLRTGREREEAKHLLNTIGFVPDANLTEGKSFIFHGSTKFETNSTIQSIEFLSNDSITILTQGSKYMLEKVL